MITPRLEMILRHAEGKSCADIGTDHAYVPIKLKERGVHVIATDISRGPLEMAAKNAEKHGCDIELRLGGGLSPLSSGETECIIIAGMGGEMIQRIIAEAPEIARESVLVLQPMNGQAELRQFLAENNFKIICEDIATEGFKVYNLMKVKSGGCDIYEDELELHLPRRLYSHPLFGALLAKKKREFTKIAEGLFASTGGDGGEIEKMKGFISRIEELEGEASDEN